VNIDLKYRTIDTATDEEIKHFNSIKSEDKWRPHFHITPPYGLLNDPNGFCYFNHEYHLFYQWYPFGTFHGMKHWMHLSSTDLFHWKEHGAKIIPTEWYESHGAYSGTALVENDHSYLFYTGNIKNNDKRDANQCLAILDKQGCVTKLANNPVIKSVPRGYTGHVRDPKVIKHGEDYYMLLGAQREATLTGCILVYQSTNLVDWQCKGELNIQTQDPFIAAFMYECPDLLHINDKDVLLISPQGVEADKHRFNNLYNVIYCVGQMNWSSLTFDVFHWDELDRGFDFYAPQTLANTPDRETLIAWAGTDNDLPTQPYGWIHSLTLPRTLSIHEDKLYQAPVIPTREALSASAIAAKETVELEHLSFMTWLIPSSDNDVITMILGDSHQYLCVVIDINNKEITMDRSHCEHHDTSWEFGCVRKSVISNPINNIQLFCDQSIVELFINDGESVFTALLFLNENKNKLKIISKNNTVVNYQLQYLAN
jgi:beta-fructofuranosidase